MNIATALNRKYVNYTIVMLTSLCINNPVHIDAYLLHCELTDDDLSLMQKSLEKYDINIIPLQVDRHLFSQKMPVTKSWSVETYFRLLLPELLPEKVNRILYLDVDLIINRDISELYNLSFEDFALAGAYSNNGTEATVEQIGHAKPREMFAQIAGSEPFYFNAGVLLFNIKWIRDHGINFDIYLNAMKKWNFDMYAPDQDILNYVFYGKVKYFDWKKYNLLTHPAYEHDVSKNEALKASILHFAGHKPWGHGIHYELEDIWWDYARKSSIYYTLMDQYVFGMNKDKFLERYFDQLSGQISEQEKVISEQKIYIDRLMNTANMLINQRKTV